MKDLIVNYIHRWWAKIKGSFILRSYSDIICDLSGTIKNFLTTIVKLLKQIKLLLLIYSSVTKWFFSFLSFIFIIAVTLSCLGYAFASIRLKWFAYFWDNLILTSYAATKFNNFWWIILPIFMILSWVAIRPTAIPWRGGWQKRYRMLMITYILFFTLFILFSWLFKATLTGTKWCWMLVLFIGVHFLYLLSIAVLLNVISKIPKLNKEYTESTKRIIGENQPVKCILEMSIYGNLIMRMAGNSFDGVIGGIIDKINIKRGRTYNTCKKYFQMSFHFLSFARIFDSLLGCPYYVYHFESVLKHELNIAEIKAQDSMSEHVIKKALKEYAVKDIFNPKAEER
ncbi:MAG: hypothetical protein ABIK92_06620 [Pseudomonadota bacterium]